MSFGKTMSEDVYVVDASVQEESQEEVVESEDSGKEIEIFYIKGNGAGFAGPRFVRSGTTIRALFEEEVDGSPSDYKITVQSVNVSGRYVLKKGDVVSITPMNVGGS